MKKSSGASTTRSPRASISGTRAAAARCGSAVSEELLREAVSNLLDNALRYGAGGRHVTVGVASSSPEIYVEDSGPGIPEGERDRVRQRFYRMPGTRGDGCGLGLSIVEEIVRRHAGELVLESRHGGSGLRARFIFPDVTLADA